MELPSYFEKFLREIRPTQQQKEDYKRGHKTLRERLHNDEQLSPIIVSTFLQGSYRRATAVRPKGGTRADVDVVVVTLLDKDIYTPDEAMDMFVPFLEKHYSGKYKRQGRSFGIELSYVDLDLVITAKPSESEIEILKSAAVTTFEIPEDVSDWRLVKSWVPMSERDSNYCSELMETVLKETEWQTEPLWIPNREAERWERTHPIAQIKWTWGKNARCNRHYVDVVKAVKWWQRVNYETDRPKGYPLEHLVGICCLDGIKSVAEGVTLTFENIVLNYKHYADNHEVPELPDHGVPEHNVFARITGEEFAQFYEHVKSAAEIAREALDAEEVKTSAEKWRELFGEKFPPPPDNDGGEKESSKGPFVAPAAVSLTGDLTPRKYGSHE
ncbi:MAG: nucleotidyltransferase [Bacillota bacterium]|nr:nucleotidyltransferase [Bacillota bacterium]